jgi:site-specific DNA-cytosine methylase
MTPHEMARLQTFPDTYRFNVSKDVVDEDGKLLRHSGVWEELTNAVPPLFARALFSRIASVLKKRIVES